MELKLEAFKYILNNENDSQMDDEKLFGVAILENNELTETYILEKDFNKYEHVNLDDYPNSEELANKIKENDINFPIVVLK